MSEPVAPRTAWTELITCLRRADIDWDGENIADLVWLSRYMEGEPIPRSRSSRPQSSRSPLRRQTESTEALPPPPPASDVGLYSGASQAQSTKAAPDRGGIPFQVPTPPALRKTLAIGRAMRPLMRKVDSYTQTLLDEEATAEQTAEQQFCLTVVRPAKERWLEVALVVEDAAASFLWRETIRDFKQVLERQGAFRAIKVWHLQTAHGDIKLFAKPPSKNTPQPSRSAKELIDASGRRLILVVSDCISSAWHTHKLHQDYLELWAAHSPVAIVQLLPGHLWSRTVLSVGLEVQLGAWLPGATNDQLLFQELPIGAKQGQSGGLKLPVITLEPNSLTQWAKMISGWGESWAAGVWFDDGWQTLPSSSIALESALSPEQLVKRFITTASDLAKRLAGLMALVPVNLPIIYLLQETMLQESMPLHLAEIFMSGLIERGDARAANGTPNSETYDFVAGVREPLMDSVPTPLKEQVLDRVSIYIGQKLNRSIYSFTALLQLERELGDTAGSDLLKFAHVAKQVLQRMGGDYAALVNALELPIRSGSSVAPPEFELPPLRNIPFMLGQLIDAEATTEPEAEWPSLQNDSFQVATVTFEPEPDDGLELFEFKIATLVQQSRDIGFLGRLFRRQEFEWVINERQGQSRQLIEVLETVLTPDARLAITVNQRLELIRALNNLPPNQFEELLFSLNSPAGLVPSSNVSQSDRVARLLPWIESSTGPGLSVLQDTLQMLSSRSSEQSTSELSKLGIEMVSIPGDTFLMGSPPDEEGRADRESPQHEVTIPPFFMGRYPVTQAQWRFVANLKQVNRQLKPDPSRFKGDNHPVERVSWYEAVEFCDRLSRHTNRTYRLPTEAEWEYACRAGTETPFHFGETIASELANYRGTNTFANGPKGEYREETTPVDHFGVANGFGLSDMHGNVWEWCQDHYHDSYEGAPTDGSAWLSDNEEASRIRRGGSWDYIPWFCRSAFRLFFNPVYRGDPVGFRVVCVAPRDS